MLSKEIRDEACARLRRRAEAVESFAFDRIVRQRFTLDAIQRGLPPGAITAWLRTDLDEEASSPAIYRISASGPAAAARLRGSYVENARATSRAMARLNDPVESRTLYVGSSRSIGKRLREHLFQGARKTYALHMGAWCPAGRTRSR